MNTESDASQKSPLRWVLVAAVILLFVSILATATVVWRMRKSAAAQAQAANASAAAATVPPAAANWSRATFTANADDGVRQTSEKSWSVKGGRAFMNVRRKDDDSLELRFVYPFDRGLLPKETVMLVRTRWGANEVAKLAGELNITPEQLAALKQVSPVTDIPVSGADKQHLRTLFDDYLSAKGAETEKALVDAVTEIDNNYYDRTIERINGIAEQVKGIFDQNQLAVLSDRFGARNR
jgi:hypothetical protein